MNRRATLAAIALGFLTAFLIGQIGETMVDSQVAAPRIDETADARARTVARGFYDDINSLFATGGTAIGSRIAAGFVDHMAGSGVDRNGDALIEELKAVRSLEPTARVEIAEISVDGPIVSVALRDRIESQTSLAGLTVRMPERNRYWELLRIDGDRVAERWSQRDGWPGTAFSVESPITLPLPQSLVPAIQRIVLRPEMEFDLTAQFAVVLYVESGTLFASTGGRDLAGVPQPADMPLASGDVRVLDDVPGRLRLRNPDSVPVSIWALSLSGVRPPLVGINQYFVERPDGFEEEIRASVAAELPAGQMLLSAAWVTLPPGAVIDTHRPGMFETIAVVDGALDSHLASGNAYAIVDFGQMIALPGAAIATAGQGFGATSEGELEYRVEGAEPATILLMTLSAPIELA